MLFEKSYTLKSKAIQSTVLHEMVVYLKVLQI
jgi:hypothetical protein